MVPGPPERIGNIIQQPKALRYRRGRPQSIKNGHPAGSAPPEADAGVRRRYWPAGGGGFAAGAGAGFLKRPPRVSPSCFTALTGAATAAALLLTLFVALLILLLSLHARLLAVCGVLQPGAA